MRKYVFLIAAVVLSSAMTSCSSSEEISGDPDEPKRVVYMLEDPQPIQLTEAQRVFANDNNQFTLNFLKTVNDVDKSGKSFIFSPLSITYVLGMVNDAATGETEKELEQTLGFHEGGIKAVNEYCKKLIDGLPKVDERVKLNIANAIFLNKNYTLKSQFGQDMQTYYDAKAEALDFSSPHTLSLINSWCSDKTNGMIPTILDEVNPNMMSYLLNAIYFKADWASKFDQNNTREETFAKENGSTELPMMHQNVLIQYLNNDIFSAVKIPYGSGLWNMMVLLPEEGKTTDDVINHFATCGLSGVEGLICQITEDNIATMKKNYFSHYEVDLKLPRFETSSDTDKLGIEGGLVGLMKNMGINFAFDSYFAEIPNMCEVPVYIAMMRQKAKIKVNEEGSEAAAVTVAGMIEMSAMPMEYPKATFHANRPFVYVIQEASSGVILFVGKFTGA
ncbi:MAG: serpin family protein [Prevotella sp.]|nr:serpin family protein [Prevotella sp.]